MDELCFAAEGLSGTAAATSLRTLGSIMERAPAGRMFGAIATLSDLSVKAAMALQDSSRAMERGREAEAKSSLGEALDHMDALATRAAAGPMKRGAAR